MPEDLQGQAKLFDALTTKGTAFTREERERYGLLGLLPTAEKTLDQQVEHCWHEFSTRRDDLDKHIYLRALQDRNETLFFRHPHPQQIAKALAQAVRPSTWCEASRTLTVTVAATGKRDGQPRLFALGSRDED